jgi:thioredoxin-related protein
MKKIVVMIFFSMVFLSCESKVSSEEKTHISMYQKALSLVQEKDSSTLVMLKLTSQECHFCKKMDKEVLADASVHTFIEKHFIVVDIDVKNEEVPLNLTYKVTPTFFFIDKHENVIYKIQGSWNKKDFIDLLEMVLKKAKGDEK